MDSEKNTLTVAIAGQPNSGKSTLFNALTGSRARVGNYPGITVDRLEGKCRSGDAEIRFVDLPGTYSLTSYSMEEVVARDVILEERPDVVVILIDATTLERSLYLAVQILEMGVPAVIGLNMMDEVAKKGIHVNAAKLGKLLRAPVVECIARRGVGKERLIEEILNVSGRRNGEWRPLDVSYGPDLNPMIRRMTERIEVERFLDGWYPARWLAVKYMEEDENVIEKGRVADGTLGEELEKCVKKVASHTDRTLNTYPEAIIADYRYGFISSVLKQGVVSQKDEIRYDISDKIDKVLTQRLLGPIIMVGVLYVLFALTFNLGVYPQTLLNMTFDFIGGTIESLVPPSLLRSLVVNGVIDGVGAVLSFAPLILIMFAMLVFLEDLGYMARVAYMLDKVFKAFGLHGSSVMPFIIAGGIPGGCAVPGVMTSRTLRSPKERLATILTAPFTLCGAKVTVYLMLADAFFPGDAAKVMFILTLFSWGAVLVTARVLRWTVIRGEPTPFVMELPPYRFPTLNGILIHTWERVWQFIKKAGTLILVISIAMWVLMTFPLLPAETRDEFADRRAELTNQLEFHRNQGDLAAAESLKGDLEKLKTERKRRTLRHSLAGRVGIALESITQYAGFPWQMNIALIGGFAAKEVVISTLSTAYAINPADQEAEDRNDLQMEGGAKQAGERDGITHATSGVLARNVESKPESVSHQGGLKANIAEDPAWTLPAIVSVFLFMLLYSPCAATIVAIAKESSWGWAIGSTLAFCLVAYGLSVVVFQIGTLMMNY